MERILRVRQERLMSVNDVAEFLGVHRNTVVRMIKKEGLPHFRFGRVIRIDRHDLLLWLRKHRRTEKPRDADEVLRLAGMKKAREKSRAPRGVSEL